MQEPENLVVCGFVMIDNSKQLSWGRNKDFLIIKTYICAVLANFAVKNKVFDWEYQSKWIVQSWVCVCYIYFS